MATGNRSMLAFWMGGASLAPMPATAGFVGMLGLWIGGSGSSGGTPTPTVSEFLIRARRRGRR